MRTSGVVLVFVAILLSVGCKGQGEQKGAPPPSASARPAGGTPRPDSPAVMRERAQKAERTFVAWCGGCHGLRGRGDGPAAAVVNPKPRDLTSEKFKIRSTPSGAPPTRQDLFDTVTRGLPGTAMPSFAFLSEEDRNLVVDHVRMLAGHDQMKAPKVISVGAEVASSAESIARGKAVYGKLECGKCHGDTGRGDGPSSKDLKDEKGRPLPARDYSKGLYMGGDTAAAMHMRFRTGLDGSGMPSFDSSLSPQDGWDLANYVLSLREAAAPAPTDKVARGRQVVAERQCNACHVIEGKGGDVGPSLDVAANKLRQDWVMGYLKDPIPYGKIYPYTPFRMPDFKLAPEDVEGVTALFAAISKRPFPEPAPAAATIDESKLGDGGLLFFLKCTECHNFGKVVPNPEAKQQGPDLINVTKRIHFEWIATWVNNPKQVYPDARMIDTNLSPEQITAVTSFVWKVASDANK